MENAKRHFAISELAKEFDVSKRHIRFCEEKGLISPKVTKLGRRIYSSYDRARLKLILHCVLIGYSQDQIVELIGMPGADLDEADQIKKGLAYAERMIEELEKRRNELSFHQRTSVINEIKMLGEYIKEIKAIPLETLEKSAATSYIPDKESKDKAHKAVEEIKPGVEQKTGRQSARMVPLYIAGVVIVLIIGGFFYYQSSKKDSESIYLVQKESVKTETQPVYRDRVPIDKIGKQEDLKPMFPESAAAEKAAAEKAAAEKAAAEKVAAEKAAAETAVAEKAAVEMAAVEKAAAEKAVAEKAAAERAAAEKAAAERAAAEKVAAERAAAEKAAAEKAAVEKAAAEKVVAQKAAAEKAAAEKAAAERAAAEKVAAEKVAAQKAAAEKAAAERAATEKAATEKAAAERAAAEKVAAEKAAAQKAAAEKAATERAAAERAAAEKAAAERAAAEKAAAERAATERAAAEKAAAEKAAAVAMGTPLIVKSAAEKPEAAVVEAKQAEINKDAPQSEAVAKVAPDLPIAFPEPEKQESVSVPNLQASEVEIKEGDTIEESDIKEPLFTAKTDMSLPQELETERPGSVEESTPSIEQEEDKETLASGGEILSEQDRKDRLESFLNIYCQTYASKDLDKFATFFTPDATENNTPFQDMLPNYRKNLEKIQLFNYRIELIAYSLQADSGNIRIQGKYFTRFLLHEGTWRENSGDITMELIENGDSYLVKRLIYGQ
ncbi:MAG: histone H1-like repetitive region-containing protein [Deltaproteobacteria bacterium]|nr:histone H1-like repetitive region-containing protein [Deltaproteobacteria bacterium]